MSSSLASIERSQFGDDHLTKRGIDLGLNRKVPPAWFGECCAFYCILFGHQNRLVAREREIVGGKGVVIGKRVASAAEREALQMREEARRVGDRGNRMQGAILELGGRGLALWIEQVAKPLPGQSHVI